MEEREPVEPWASDNLPWDADDFDWDLERELQASHGRWFEAIAERLEREAAIRP
jgi:hypothetical protein